MIVLDTHALLWWALDPERLSPAAAKAVEKMERVGGYASAISIWELGLKVKRKKLELPFTISEFCHRIERGGVVELIPVDAVHWMRSLALPWSHPDPADRIIVATSLLKDAPLVTCDDAIRGFEGVSCVW